MLFSHQKGQEELNALLDVVHGCFTAIVRREGLQQSSIRLWRRYYPVVKLTWVVGEINRNINVLLSYGQDGGLVLAFSEPVIEVIEVNAWKDSYVADGNRLRHWRHEIIVRKAKAWGDPEHLVLLVRSIQLAYKEVSNFTEDQLDRKTVIDSASSGFY